MLSAFHLLINFSFKIFQIFWFVHHIECVFQGPFQHTIPQLMTPTTSNNAAALSRFASAQTSFYATSTTNVANLMPKEEKFKLDAQGYSSTAATHPANIGAHPQQTTGFSLQSYQYNGPL